MELRTGPHPAAVVPSPDALALRRALFPPELPFGAEVELRADAGLSLTAVCTTAPHLPPTVAGGQFLLSLTEAGRHFTPHPEQSFSREEILRFLSDFLNGDRASLERLTWAEVVDHRLTGEFRARAV